MEYLIQESTLDALANAIRSKTGGTDTLTPAQMVAAINGLQTGGGATEPYVEETYDSNGNLIGAALHGQVRVRSNLFFSCSSLSSVVLPDTVKSIESSAFKNCRVLKNINLPDGLQAINQGAFESCSQITNIVFPVSLLTLDSQVFYFGGLKQVTFQGTPTSISSSALAGAKVTTINVPWAEGVVANAPWGATNATINYNYTGGSES